MTEFSRAAPRFKLVDEAAGASRADPLINALIEKLPPIGTAWPADQRKAWLDLMSQAFTLAYGATSGGAMRSSTQSEPTAKSGKAKPRPPRAKAPLTKPEHQFTIDRQGMARDHKGDRILPEDVNDTIYDERGQMGDLAAIEWADGTRGIPKGMQLDIAAA